MTCRDMMELTELSEVLWLRGGSTGLDNPIRWIYFADALDCIQSDYRVEDYVHGGEFVVLTNRHLTDNPKKLLSILTQMCDLHIAGLGVNEGQIPAALSAFCDEKRLPLFELAERYPLVDLSQLLCSRIVLEQGNRSSAEQLLSSIIDAAHLNHDNVYAQARFLGVDLSGYFCVAEFAFTRDLESEDAAAVSPLSTDSFALGHALQRLVNAQCSALFTQKILTQLQTGSLLALLPAGKVSEALLKEALEKIVQRAQAEYHMIVTIGVGDNVGALEEVRMSRAQAASAIRFAEMSGRGREAMQPSMQDTDASPKPSASDHIFFYKDQGIYTLLSHIEDTRFLDEFVEKHLGKLFYADEIAGGSLSETLSCYLSHSCNVTETAEALYLHRNTMRYRLDKIWEILGKESTSLDDLMTLRLAFLIHEMRRH